MYDHLRSIEPSAGGPAIARVAATATEPPPVRPMLGLLRRIQRNGLGTVAPAAHLTVSAVGLVMSVPTTMAL